MAKSNPTTVLNFWATWAEPCKDMNEVFEELSRQYPTLQYAKLEAENFPEISEQFEIAAVPTFVVVKNGKIVDRVEGANAPNLTAIIEKHAKAPAAPAVKAATESTVDKEAALEKRLKSLINTQPVMLFMKGTPQQPRCGFSRQTIELLNEQGVKYGSFNILADEEVRSGLKKFSNWPTYPQIYINGELVGGLDILKEMIESGEFAQLAPKEEDLNTRLKNLINKSTVMLFMKGDPDTPKCGFSRQIVGILKDQGVPFDTFDILEDDEVRQGLKAYSSWPTYPQLYIKGELMGGLDIVKEMVENGELKEALA
ncbi:Glutaredoxin 3 [Rhizophlyctis rosea]|nr:Glutaredoxin 3 [Rhizophlyctis rosea]